MICCKIVYKKSFMHSCGDSCTFTISSNYKNINNEIPYIKRIKLKKNGLNILPVSHKSRLINRIIIYFPNINYIEIKCESLFNFIISSKLKKNTNFILKVNDIVFLHKGKEKHLFEFIKNGNKIIIELMCVDEKKSDYNKQSITEKEEDFNVPPLESIKNHNKVEYFNGNQLEISEEDELPPLERTYNYTDFINFGKDRQKKVVKIKGIQMYCAFKYFNENNKQIDKYSDNLYKIQCVISVH